MPVNPKDFETATGALVSGATIPVTIEPKKMVCALTGTFDKICDISSYWIDNKPRKAVFRDID